MSIVVATPSVRAQHLLHGPIILAPGKSCRRIVPALRYRKQMLRPYP
ncbi:MAG: hypothetical protein ACLFVO_19820 [Chloroflexaceae bacterium]